jgi:hypothetical protein
MTGMISVPRIATQILTNISGPMSDGKGLVGKGMTLKMAHSMMFKRLACWVF